MRSNWYKPKEVQERKPRQRVRHESMKAATEGVDFYFDEFGGIVPITTRTSDEVSK